MDEGFPSVLTLKASSFTRSGRNSSLNNFPPDDLMVEGERVNMEYTLYRNWMGGQYLKDLHWYHKYLFLEYDPSLETLFDPLVVCSSYKRKLEQD